MTKSSSKRSNTSRIKSMGSRSSILPPHLRLFVLCRLVDFFDEDANWLFKENQHFTLDAHLSGLSFQNLDVAEAVL